MRILRFAAVAALLGSFALPVAAQEVPEFPHQKWSFQGIFGTYDRAAAQRGFQVYKEVCAACHSLKQGYFRDLKGLGLDEKQITAIASTATVSIIGDDGQPAQRPGLPSDHFVSPYPNEKAAAAVLGKEPPDLSVIVKAREHGPDYVYALLNGYREPPAGFALSDGTYYNSVYPGHQIKMPKPLSDDQVTYADGTKATLEQESHDLVTFLAYMANPEMEQRKRMGVKVVLFLLLMTGVTYAVKRKIWAKVDH